MMFCPNCGKELPPTARFCGGCGTPAPEPFTPQAESAPQPQPVYQAQPVYQQAAPQQTAPSPRPKSKKKGRLAALLAIPAAVIVAGALAVAFNFTALAARVAPEYALNRGVEKLNASLEKQSGASSFLPTLFRYWSEGAFAFSGALEEPEHGDKISFSGTLLTAQEGREIMLQDFTITSPYKRVSPISFYLSGDALAVSGYDITGDSGWYGLYLNRPLAEQNSRFQYLSPERTEYLQRQIDVLSDFLNSQEDPRAAVIAGELGETVHSFLDSGKPSVSSQTVHVGNSDPVKATVLTYQFDNRDLSILAGNLFDVLLEKDNAAYLANSYLTMEGYYYIDDDDVADWVSNMIEAREEIVSSLRDDIKGDVTLQFALSSNGALVQAACTGSFENRYDDTAGFEGSLSFGSNGDMDFNLKLTDDDNAVEISVTSVTTNLGMRGGVNQTIKLEYKDLYYDSSSASYQSYYDGENSLILSTDWNPSANEFSTSFTFTDNGDIEFLLRANGTLSTGTGAMELDIEEFSCSAYSWWDGELQEAFRGSFQLNARAGSSLRMPDFKNIFDHEAIYYMF